MKKCLLISAVAFLGGIGGNVFVSCTPAHAQKYVEVPIGVSYDDKVKIEHIATIEHMQIYRLTDHGNVRYILGGIQSVAISQ